jgi:MYXO-CTERM domain-containing protein
MFRSRRLGILLLSFCALAPSVASAHIRMDVPKSRMTTNATLKQGPCGNMTPDTPQTIEGWVAGATVTIEFTETIDHDSHYRVALSREGDAAFMDPENKDDKATDGIDLVDGIPDEKAGNNRKQEVEITLPDEPCEDCVLQLIQYMYDNPNTPIYYQCADIVIGPNPDGGGTGGSDGGGSGGSDGAGGAVGVGGGDAETGGADSAGGANSGGASAGGASAGGAVSAGGAAASGGAAISVGGASAAGGAAAIGGSSGSDDSTGAGGGGCSLGATPSGAPVLLGLASLLGLGLRRLRRRASRT